jgi:hypothetical protein
MACEDLPPSFLLLLLLLPLNPPPPPPAADFNITAVLEEEVDNYKSTTSVLNSA